MRSREHANGAGVGYAMTALRNVTRVLTWFAAAAVFFVLGATVLIPLIMGWTPLTVLSGSMEPTIPTGSQVVVKHVEGTADAAELDQGDVVTFMPNPDDPTLVTHRIVDISVKADGTHIFTTKGDNNNSADPDPITATQLRGVVQYHVPYAGYLSNLLNTQQKTTGVIIVAAALLAYALWQLLTAIRSSKRSRRHGRRASTTMERGNEQADP